MSDTLNDTSDTPKKTCLGLHCPERTGGECTAGDQTLADELRDNLKGWVYPVSRNEASSLGNLRPEEAIDGIVKLFDHYANQRVLREFSLGQHYILGELKEALASGKNVPERMDELEAALEQAKGDK